MVKNPGPRRTSQEDSFTTCHWNVNGILAHDYVKASFFQVYISINKFYWLCLSRTFLDSSIDCDDINLVVPGYTLIWSDHPPNCKWGGVCVYSKDTLSFKVIIFTTLRST